MTDKVPEIPTVIPTNRSNNFNSVTTAGNKAVTELVKVVNSDPVKIVDTIKKVVPEVLSTLIEVVFEKSKIWSVVDRDDNLDYYRNLDYDSWINPSDLNNSELKQAKVLTLISQKELIRKFFHV